MEQIPGKVQICRKCLFPKDVEKDFRNRTKDGHNFIEKVCKQCQYKRTSEKRKSEEFKKQKRENYAKNKEIINILRRSKYVKRERIVKEKVSKEHKLQKIKEWQQANPEKRKATVDRYHKNHVEQEKQYYQDNKAKIKARISTYNEKNRSSLNEKLKERRKDPIVRLRHNISCLIRWNIKERKIGSCMKYLPYTIQELKQHLEKQFELWMNWNNQGIYNPKTWDDNNSKTWKWQIDHIVPQSKLPYSSMEDENFKKCWALENLRPLSAKRNVINGSKLKRKV